MSSGIIDKNNEYLNRRSIRLKGYDYSYIGAYFVTICTQNREYLLGNITSGKMSLNEFGEIAGAYWKKIPEHFPNVKLDKYVIMPNHIHGIIIITKTTPALANNRTSVGAGSSRPNGSPSPDEARAGEPRPYGGNTPTLGKIVAYYKYQSTKQINQIRNVGIKKIWQRNYYERIIRNNHELNRICEYIINNPVKWDEDKYNLCSARVGK